MIRRCVVKQKTVQLNKKNISENDFYLRISECQAYRDAQYESINLEIYNFFKSEEKKFISQYSRYIFVLKHMPLREAFFYWLDDIGYVLGVMDHHQKLLQLIELGVLPDKYGDGNLFDIGGLRSMRNDRIIKKIRDINGQDTTKLIEYIQAYEDFSKYLETLSHGWFKRVSPEMIQLKKGNEPLSSNRTITRKEFESFMYELEGINKRDHLIALVIVYSAAKLSQVLNLLRKDVDPDNGKIIFSKKLRQNWFNDGRTLPDMVMKRLLNYMNETSNGKDLDSPVFVTRREKRLTRSRINYSFTEASKRAGVKNITPEILRMNWEVFNSENYINNKEVDNE